MKFIFRLIYLPYKWFYYFKNLLKLKYYRFKGADIHASSYLGPNVYIDVNHPPGKIKIGHAGVGSFTYTTGAVLMKQQGAKVVFVPVGKRRTPALLSGEVDAISVPPPVRPWLGRGFRACLHRAF